MPKIALIDRTNKKLMDLPSLKGKDGKGVTVGTREEFEADENAILNFDPNEVVTQDTYSKTQADVKFAKSVEVGDTSKLVVTSWKDLVTAINDVFGKGMGGYNFVVNETQKILTILTRDGNSVPIDISQIILNTNITEFKDMLVTSILDGQSLVWNASKKKWVNKSIDSSGVLVEAKQYTDDEIKKFNNKGSLAVDEKPTYYGGIITYKQGGVTKTTENAGTWFYYFDENSKAVQTIFIEGTEFTIAMAGDINLDDYVAKTEKTDTYDDSFTDKTKVPTTRYIEEFKGVIDDEIADKVNTTDIEDSLTSDAIDKPLSAKQGKELNEKKLDKENITSDFAENPTDLGKVPNLNWINGMRNVLLSALGKKVDKAEGKSLVDDTEIERLADVDNYDDTEIKESIDELNVNLGVLEEGKVDKRFTQIPQTWSSGVDNANLIIDGGQKENLTPILQVSHSDGKKHLLGLVSDELRVAHYDQSNKYLGNDVLATLEMVNNIVGSLLPNVPKSSFTDCNNAPVGFASHNNVANAPNATLGHIYLLTLRFDNNALYQHQLCFCISDNSIYSRTCTNGTWLAWKKL